jgi:hypothetical protein
LPTIAQHAKLMSPRLVNSDHNLSEVPNEWFLHGLSLLFKMTRDTMGMPPLPGNFPDMLAPVGARSRF